MLVSDYILNFTQIALIDISAWFQKKNLVVRFELQGFKDGFKWGFM